MSRIEPRRVGWCACGALVAALVWSASRAKTDVAPVRPQGDPAAFTDFISSGLSSPIGVVNAGDGSGRLFIVQQGGAVRVAHGNALNPNALLAINPVTTCRPGAGSSAITVGFTGGGERGLLGIAFHPDFGTNGRLFVSFTDTNGDTMIARYTMADPAIDELTPEDRDSCLIVLRVDQDGANHNGGNIAFGPDGYLYVGFGDGGGGGSTPGGIGSNDACNRSQTLDPANLVGTDNCAVDASFTASGGNADSRALLGKMLRIDVDRTTPAATPGLCGQSSLTSETSYAIPDEDPGTAGNQGNPFADGSTANGCDEVWSIGLRNPWRWSFDRHTGDLLIGDVGQGASEEVDFEPAGSGGRNYGWKCFEGEQAINGCPVPPAQTSPIITYAHAAGRCSITGGYRYRGPVIGVAGDYFYADYCTGEVWTAIETSPGVWSQPGAPFQDMSTVPSFGEDEDGHLYVISGSQVFRLSGTLDPLFTDGFE